MTERAEAEVGAAPRDAGGPTGPGSRPSRFDGFIAGLGTPAGFRVVVGHWPRSPFGAFSDVMVERPDGHRMLLAPAEVADFVASTYTFDEVCHVPVDVAVEGRGAPFASASNGRLPGPVRSSLARRDAPRPFASASNGRLPGPVRSSLARRDAPRPFASGDRWTVRAGPLELAFTVGGRPALGALLRAVPRRLAVDPRWVTAIDVVARRVLPGVRTRGSAGQGRREYYAALDLRRLTDARVTWHGADQGGLAPVDPPVRFGFGSTPRTPSLVRVVTRVEPERADDGGGS